ncbi:MAG: hypothetical protein Q9191_004342 [Dirinaria sp. TL-2023a]
MLAISLLFTLLVAGFAAAQNNTLNPSQVDLTTKNQWCGAQKDSCPMLCGGKQYTLTNNCDGMTLNYTCTCANGTGPLGIAQYSQTLPSLECERAFQQCNTANPGADFCNSNCGKLNPSDVKAAAGASSTSSAPASSTSGPAATGTAAAPATTPTKGAAIKFAPEMGLAAAVAGAMGVLL